MISSGSVLSVYFWSLHGDSA